MGDTGDLVQLLVDTNDPAEIKSILRRAVSTGILIFSADEVYEVTQVSQKRLREAKAYNEAVETVNRWMK